MPYEPRLALPLLALSLAMLAGCGSTQGATQSASPGTSRGTPAYVDGTWIGRNTTGAETYVLLLKQTGNNVRGTIRGAGADVDGPVEGTVDSNSIQLSTKFRETPLLRASCEQITGYLRNTAVDLRRATPYTVDGTWAGGTTAGITNMVVVLKQNGNNVTGTLSGAGRIDGPIDGTVQGNTIQLRERTGFRETPQLKVSCEQIAGPLYDGSTVTLHRIP